VLRPVQTGYVVCARVGTPALPHVVVIGRGTWMYAHDNMDLDNVAITLVRLFPGGPVPPLIDAVANLYTEATKRETGAGALVAVDVSRSHELVQNFSERLSWALFSRTTRGLDDRWDLPSRILGRTLLLSKVRSWAASRKLTIALGESEHPLEWGTEQVLNSLNSVQRLPPEEDPQTIGAEVNVDHDVALTIGLTLSWMDFLLANPHVELGGEDAA
jgi:hypothetical protein